MPAGTAAAFGGEHQCHGCRELYITSSVRWFAVQIPATKPHGHFGLHNQGLCFSASSRCVAVSLGASFLLRCAGAGGLPTWQHGFRAHAQRNACNGRERAEWEALDIPVKLAPNDVVVHWLWLT